MKKILNVVLVMMMVLSSTVSVRAETEVSAKVQAYLDKMTSVEKMAQMIQADTRWITPEEVAKYKFGSILSGGGAAPSAGNKLENWANSADNYQKAVVDAGGIPLLYGIDAVHGNNNVYGATIYPHNIGLGAANDPKLVEAIGKQVASEMKAMGANWAFTPTLGVPHNERWGRTYETFGDHVERVTQLGSAYVTGIESQNLLASAKHFLGEGIAKNGINQGNIELSDEDYRDLIAADMDNPIVNELLTPYKKVIADGVKSIMITYSAINGKKCHGNKDVVTTLLKENLGFDGIVISDYNGLDQIAGSSYKEKAVACINAGVDVLMVAEQDGNTPRWKNLYNALEEAVNEGLISEERLNDAVTRILTVKAELGLLDDNPTNIYASIEDQKLFGGQDHRDLARIAVRQSLVLLKNDEYADGVTMMQALQGMDNIMVAGSAADDIGRQCGGWTITWQGAAGSTTKGTTIFSALKAAMEAKGGTINYSAHGSFKDTENNIDAAIVVVGETPYAESNGDRSEGQLKLPTSDIEVIQRIKSEHPELPIVLVLETGRPIAIADYVKDGQVKAIVNAWFPGSEGDGVADVLLGNEDFTATNPITWTWYPQHITEKYTDDKKVLYAVGYGLTKASMTKEMEGPEDPTIVDLGQTNGKLEAEAFFDAHGDIKLENNGTTVGYLDNNRHMTYKVKVPEQAAYKLTLQAAREYAEKINGAFELYLDGELVLQRSDTAIVSTGSWTNFTPQVMEGKVSLKEGTHELKLIARAKDFNIDYFIFEKAGEYVGPIVPEDVTNEGTGAMLKEDAVNVSMSSSEHSQSMDWYKGEFEISNKNEDKDPLDLRVSDDSNQTTILVNDQKTYQNVLGMGTSIEEATINNLLKMTDENRQAFLRRLLDPVNGMGMSLIRVTIGTSDFTAKKFYSYYDGTGKELNGKPDWYNETGKGFSIQKDKDYGIIKVLNEMQDIAKELGVEDNLKFFASSWTPPGWMKLPTSSSNSYKNNEQLLKGGQLNDAYINDLAKYMVRFLEEYQKQGIDIYAMTIQNEPLLEIDYPSCAMTGTQEAKIAKALKQEIANSTVLNGRDVKIWAFDHNFDGANKFMNDFFKEAGEEFNIDGIAFHPYGGNASTMGEFYKNYKDQLTMHLTERSVWGTNGANDIITWLRNGAESYNSWVTMLDSNVGTHQWVGTPDPTLFVQDANNPQNYWATPEVYIMSQFTKYIKPGFVRIDTNNGSSSTVTNVAFKDPETGNIVLVVTNRSGSDQKFKVVMNGTQFNAVLPAGNTATYTWDGSLAQVQANEVPGSLKPSDAVKFEGAEIKDNTFNDVMDGAWAEYLVDVKETGYYSVNVRHSIGPSGYPATSTSNTDSKKIILESDGKEVGYTVVKRFNTWPKNGDDYSGWQDYKDVRILVKLESGVQNLKLSLPSGNINIGELTFAKVNANHDIPGYISALDYSYAENLVIENHANIGFFDAGDKLEYTVNVQKADTYGMKLEYACGNASSEFDIFVDGEVVQTSSLNGTGAWDKYGYGTVELELAAGSHKVMFVPKDTGGFNLKSLSFGSYITVDSDELEEGQLDSKVINVTLVDGTFVSEFNKEAWQLEGLPAGIDYSIERVNDTHAVITLSGHEDVDYDKDLTVTVKFDASQVNQEGYVLSDRVTIKANNDEESLGEIGNVAFETQTMNLTIVGGKFNQDLSIDDFVLSENLAKFINITHVTVNDTEQVAMVTFERIKTNYENIVGTISVKASGYSDGQVELISNCTLVKTDELPEAIEVNDTPVSLNEEMSYRNEGTLANGAKGDYVDFYLDIKEEGNYVISYRVKDQEAVANGLKLSGGAGFATDNLGSVSFGKYWGGTQSYVQMLNLKAGEQTLRFEVNNPGFTLTNIKIERLINAVEVNDGVGLPTVITADKAIDGSKEVGWGIEGSNIKNIGFGAKGAYQDYYIDVKKAGVYDVTVNYSHDCGGDTKAILMSADGQNAKYGEVVLKNTGGWANYKDSDTFQIKLEAGKQFIRVYDDWDGFNYRNFTLTFVKDLDKVAPVITGQNAIVSLGDETSIQELLQLAVTDDVDGDLLDKATLTTEYDSHKVGIYTVTVTVSDDFGNETTKEFTIEVVDKTALSASIEACESVKEEYFTAESYANLQKVLADAKEVYADENATQEEIDAIFEKLNEAWRNLVVQADKEALSNAIEEANKLNEKDYTAESWAKFQEALTNAKEVLDKDIVTQKEIDEATKVLKDTMDKLVESVPTDPDQPLKPVDPDKPGNTDTSDNAMIEILSIVCLISLIGCVLFTRKRKEI